MGAVRRLPGTPAVLRFAGADFAGLAVFAGEAGVPVTFTAGGLPVVVLPYHPSPPDPARDARLTTGSVASLPVLFDLVRRHRQEGGFSTVRSELPDHGSDATIQDNFT